jgi:tripartite-type tricarboxylate transporter receptor subunit TctC
MSPEAVKWWQDTLQKVVGTPKWNDYIKRNLLTPTDWTGEKALQYLDGLHTKYDEAIKGLKATQK